MRDKYDAYSFSSLTFRMHTYTWCRCLGVVYVCLLVSGSRRSRDGHILFSCDIPTTIAALQGRGGLRNWRLRFEKLQCRIVMRTNALTPTRR